MSASPIEPAACIKRPFSPAPRFSRGIDDSGGTLGADQRRTSTMNRLDLLSERALDLAGHAGDSLRSLAPKASTLLDSGMKLGAARAGARAGLAVVRRNPVIAVATIAGAGLLWYAARRRARRAENGNASGETIEGSARRIETRNAEKSGGRAASRRKTGGTARRTGGSRSRSTATESRTEH